MIILIIKMILSDYQIIIVHIIILLDHLVSWRHGHLLDDQDMSKYCWYDDWDSDKDGDDEDGNDHDDITDEDDHLATSSPLMERIWSPGMSLSTLGPPPVTNLRKLSTGGHYCYMWYIAVPVSLLIGYWDRDFQYRAHKNYRFHLDEPLKIILVDIKKLNRPDNNWLLWPSNKTETKLWMSFQGDLTRLRYLGYCGQVMMMVMRMLMQTVMVMTMKIMLMIMRQTSSASVLPHFRGSSYVEVLLIWLKKNVNLLNEYCC